MELKNNINQLQTLLNRSNAKLRSQDAALKEIEESNELLKSKINRLDEENNDLKEKLNSLLGGLVEIDEKQVGTTNRRKRQNVIK